MLPLHHLGSALANPGFLSQGVFKGLRILRVTGLGWLPGDQHREIRAVFLAGVVPRASGAKSMQRSLPAGAVWCEAPAPPREAQTHHTGSK